jgi:sec-independent protein translocase protein TatA
MGLGGVSFWQLLIVFGIVILVFGTSRLKSFGGDLGGAIKGFKKAMDTDEDTSSSAETGESKKISSDGQPDATFSEHEEKEKEKEKQN